MSTYVNMFPRKEVELRRHHIEEGKYGWLFQGGPSIEVLEEGFFDQIIWLY